MCMAQQLGIQGFAAIIAAGFAAYEAWDARQDTREARGRYVLYHERWNIPGANYDPELDKLHYQLWQEAESEELKMYTAVAGLSGYAGYQIFKAAVVCAPTALAPVP